MHLSMHSLVEVKIFCPQHLEISFRDKEDLALALGSGD